MTEPNDMVVATQPHPVEVVHLASEPETGVLGEALRRRWRVALLVTLMSGAASCSGVWLLMPPHYAVGATILVDPIQREILFRDADTDISRVYRQYLNTQARILASPALIASTLNAPGIGSLPSLRDLADPVADIRSRLEIEQVRGTQLMQVTLTGKDAGDMAVIVNALTKAYLVAHENKKRQRDDRQLKSLHEQEEGLLLSIETQSFLLREMSIQGSSAAIDEWVAELRRTVTAARNTREVAAVKLAALDSMEDPEALVHGDHRGFGSYLPSDGEWTALRQSIRALETAHLDDRRLGRGASHPDVLDRPDRITAMRAQLARRESELREQYVVSLRLGIDAERFDAEITVRVLEEELDRLGKRQSDAAHQVVELDDIRHERDRLEGALARVREKIWNVEVEQNRVPRVTIDARAVAPKTPNIDKRPKYLAAALFASLLLGAVTALLRNQYDTSVREPGEVPSRLGMPLLGSVAYIPNADAITLGDDERMSEPMRGISTALLASAGNGRMHSRLVTSPTAGSGKSSLAVSLARNVARTGRRVLLVDADNAGQGVTRVFDLTGHLGLAEFLRGDCRSDEVLASGDVPGLQILPAGQRDDRFGDLLVQRRAQERARALFQSFDEVIVDSPPVLGSSHALVLATLVDEVVLVLRAGKSTREQAQAARHYLATVGGKVVGVILNAVGRTSSRYGYGYGYGYSGGRGNAGPQA